jgi:hypothetical protein
MTSTLPSRQSGISADTYADFAGAKECDRFLRGICKRRCADADGTPLPLHQEHIIPKNPLDDHDPGTNDLANLRLLCSKPNEEKGNRPDDYYLDTTGFFDQELYSGNLRDEQHEKGCDLVSSGYKNLFSTMPDNLFKVFMVLSWLVGTGKTIGMIGILVKINEVRREKEPYGWRIRRVLWLVHQRSLVDSIALELGGKDLGGKERIESELVEHGVLAVAPKVGTVSSAEDWLLHSDKDIVVACPQAIWPSEKRALGDDVLRRYLGAFDAIVVDESQYAVERYLELHNLAPKTLKFAVSSTHFDKDMVFLSQMSAGAYRDRFRLFSVSGYRPGDVFKDIRPVFDTENRDNAQQHIDECIERARLEEDDREALRLLPPLNTSFYVAMQGKDQIKGHGGELMEGDDSSSEAVVLNGVRSSAVVNRAIDIASSKSAEYGYDVHVMVRTGSIVDAIRLAEVYSSPESLQEFGPDFGATCVYAGSKGEHLGSPNHPWMLAKRNGGQAVRGSKRLVFVVDIGQFGINQPACAVIAWTDVVYSMIDLVQRIGRAIRKKSGIGGSVHLVWDEDQDPRGEFRIRLHKAVDYIINMEEYVTQAFEPLDTLENVCEINLTRTVAPGVSAKRKAEIVEVLGEALVSRDAPIDANDAWEVVVDNIYKGKAPDDGSHKQIKEIISAIVGAADDETGFHDQFFNIPRCHDTYAYVIRENIADRMIGPCDVYEEIKRSTDLRESAKRREIEAFDQGDEEATAHWIKRATQRRDREFRIPPSSMHPHQILGVNQAPRNWPRGKELPDDKKNIERSYADRLKDLFTPALERAIEARIAEQHDLAFHGPYKRQIRSEMYRALGKAVRKSLYAAAARKLNFKDPENPDKFSFSKKTIHLYKDQISHALCMPVVSRAILGYAQGLVLKNLSKELPGLNHVFHSQIQDICPEGLESDEEA